MDVNSELAIVPIDRQRLAGAASSAGDLLRQARELVVRDPAGYQGGVELLRAILSRAKAIEELFRPTIASAYRAHRQACALRDAALQPTEQAARMVEKVLREWEEEQRAIELKRKAEEEARLRREAEERRLAEALLMEQHGFREEAEARLEAALDIPPVVPAPMVPKVEGRSFRRRLVARVVDADAVPREYCSPDPKKIDAHKAAYQDTRPIPGVVFEWVTDSVTRLS